MTWQLVKKKVNISEELVTFCRIGYNRRLEVYLPVYVRERIYNFAQYKYVNVYREGSKLLFQFAKSPTSLHSRRVTQNCRFAIPWRELREYWNDGLKRMRVPVIIKKNDIIMDLKDLRNVDE